MGLLNKIFKSKEERSKDANTRQEVEDKTPENKNKSNIMNDKVKFIIDGKECMAELGTNLVEAAKANGVYIPTLCHLEGVKPAGSCRICNVKINGRYMTACTTDITDGMVIENNTPDIQELRNIIIETLFVSGNHYCPACEKSGNCELQGLGYKYKMLVPRFPVEFEEQVVDACSP